MNIFKATVIRYVIDQEYCLKKKKEFKNIEGLLQCYSKDAYDNLLEEEINYAQKISYVNIFGTLFKHPKTIPGESIKTVQDFKNHCFPRPRPHVSGSFEDASFLSL